MIRKEKGGIYNVTFNEKKATAIKTDIEAIQEAVIEYIAMYVRGWHNERRNKGMGAEHIKLHLEKGSEGEIHIEELVNLGNSLRKYLKKFDEPFKDNETAKVYEWQNDKGVRFRVITDKMRGEGHSNTPLSPSGDIIVTFYSDRNINKAMEFKNPKVKEYYENNEIKNDKGTNNSIFSNFKAKSKEIKNHTQRIDQKINKNETAIQKNNQQTLENSNPQIKTKRKQR